MPVLAGFYPCFIDVHTHAFHPKIAQKSPGPAEKPLLDHPCWKRLAGRFAGTGPKKPVSTRRFILDRCHNSGTGDPGQRLGHRHQKKLPGLHSFRHHPSQTSTKWKTNWIGWSRQVFLDSNSILIFKDSEWMIPPFFDVMEIDRRPFRLSFSMLGDTLPPDENPSCPRKLAALRKAFPAPPIISRPYGWISALGLRPGLPGGPRIFSWIRRVSLDFLDDTMLKTIVQRLRHRNESSSAADYPLFDASERTEKKNWTHALKLTVTEMGGPYWEMPQGFCQN